MSRPMLTKRCRNWGTKSESLSLVGNIEHGSRLKVHRRASSMEVQLGSRTNRKPRSTIATHDSPLLTSPLRDHLDNLVQMPIQAPAGYLFRLQSGTYTETVRI